MIHETRRRIGRELNLALAERTREESALPTDLWKRPVSAPPAHMLSARKANTQTNTRTFTNAHSFFTETRRHNLVDTIQRITQRTDVRRASITHVPQAIKESFTLNRPHIAEQFTRDLLSEAWRSGGGVGNGDSGALR